MHAKGPGHIWRGGFSRAEGLDGERFYKRFKSAESACPDALVSAIVLMAAKHELLRVLYEAFNARNVEKALSGIDRKSTRLNSSHRSLSRMPSSA